MWPGRKTLAFRSRVLFFPNIKDAMLKYEVIMVFDQRVEARNKYFNAYFNIFFFYARAFLARFTTILLDFPTFFFLLFH